MGLTSSPRYNQPALHATNNTDNITSRFTSPQMSSSPTSYAPTVTPSSQQKLNVVTRVAIEGKAEQGQSGAALKMYLKISLPLESVSPGTMIPLFSEENVKIITSQVHPLDSISAPYSFSSTLCPLLHNAARALSLPARSPISYLSVFGLSPPVSSSVSSSSRSSRTTASSKATLNDTDVAPVDIKYAGHILVSGYQVSYVLPNEFPPQPKLGSRFTGDNESYSRSNTPYKSRRSSMGDKNTLQFMVAIDMYVPYISRPPRSPYLLSIPTPRCLQNHLKLRIFAPASTSNSFASLSSIDEDASSWELTSDPHVTRTPSRLSRSNSYSNQLADDESSDSSSTGFSDGYGIQGTFPSTARIRVRWAKPMKMVVDVPDAGGGRRRVGVKEVTGEMTCIIIGKGRDQENNHHCDGIVMNVEYKGTCKDVWFPGVATLLGMDIGLEAKGSDVSWADGYEKKWSVCGGTGYTGFDTGMPPRSRHPSTDSPPQPHTSLNVDVLHLPSTSRHNSNSSTTSLLRAPLPTSNIADYSFEASGSSPSITLSSISSLPQSSNANILPFPNGPHNVGGDPGEQPPGLPIILHINMNELIPPAKNCFTFTISGTILVTPRRSSQSNTNARSSLPTSSTTNQDGDIAPEPIVLPRFTVLAADSESTTFTIRNEVELGMTKVEVYNSSGDIVSDAQARKTVLQRGGFTKCGEDGGRIVLRYLNGINGYDLGTPNGKIPRPSSRPRTPVGSGTRSAHFTSAILSRPRRDGPLMIPSVTTTVTPLVLGHPEMMLPNAYAVCVSLSVPPDTGSDWLEFGLAQIDSESDTSADILNLQDPSQNNGLPRVEIAGVSLNSIPVQFETTVAVAKQEQGLDTKVPFEQVHGKEWVTWIRVHTPDGGALVVDYVVQESSKPPRPKGKWKGKAKDEKSLDIFLPTFSLPVGRLEVHVDGISGLEIKTLRSNLMHQQDLPNTRKLLHFAMEELFCPRLFIAIAADPIRASPSATELFSKLMRVAARFSSMILSLILMLYLLNFGTELRQIKQSLETCSTAMGSDWNGIPEPVTITTTVFVPSDMPTRWWFGEHTANTELPAQAPTSRTAPMITSRTSHPFPQTETSLSRASSPSEVTTTTASDSTNPFALLSVSNFLFPFDFDVYRTFDKMLETLDTMWRIIRRIYHYPLDPP